jgi:hypothetical protein
MRSPSLAGLAICILSGTLVAQAKQFLEAPQYGTGSSPQAVAYADFNGDGIPDLAVANSASNTVSILLGNGDGTFQPKVDYPVDTNPQAIAAGDINGDGFPDLVVANAGSNTISILPGNGNGTFQSKKDLTTGTNPRGVAIGSFTSAGYLDIAVTNAGDNTVGIFINMGGGAFRPQVTYKTGFNPYFVTTADFNNDGNLDLAVANNNLNNIVSVLLGNGDGTFQNQFQYTTGSTPVWIATGDFNGDGNIDMAVANQQGNTISVLLGEGNGGFSTHVDYPVEAFPTAVAALDLNNDGKPDLAVSSGNGNVVTVLWGNGDGTFSGQLNIGTGNIPYSVVIAQLTVNGQYDLVVANSGADTVSVIINNGNGTFQSRIDYPAGAEPYSVATADFNGDGFLDLAVAASNCSPTCGPGSISIILGNGDGSFQPPVSYSTGTNSDPYSLLVADFNGDNIPDIAVANYATNTVSVMLGVGDGTFGAPIDTPVGREPASLASADFNGDGKMDLAVANFHDNTVTILLGNGNGTFQPAKTYTVGNGPVSVAVGKFNSRSNNWDLVVINETDNDAGILLGNGNGTFQPQVVYPTGAGGNPLAVVVQDFNGDNIPDLAVADFHSEQVSVLLGNGDGTFQPVQAYPTGANPSSVVSGDFNGDGIPDLALASRPLAGSQGNLLSLLLGNGDGTFASPVVFGTGSISYSSAAGDFNNDGALDLAVANGGSNTVSLLLNTQGTQIALTSSSNPSGYGQSVKFTATVTASVSGQAAPTGTITLKNGATVLGSGTLANGSFSASASTLPTGSNTISAVYSGDGNFQPHTVTLIQNVASASTATTLASSANPVPLGQPVTFTATVNSTTSGTPTGSVTFLDGTTSIGSSSLNSSGVAILTTSTLAAGAQPITAAYGGSASFGSSTSPLVNQIVQGNTTAALASSPNPSSFEQAVTLVATLTANISGTPSGTVTFSNGNTTLGSETVNTGGVATLVVTNLPVGMNNITASYMGSGNFDAAPPATVGQSVQKAPTTTALSNSSTTMLALSATVASTTTGMPAGTVTFLDGSTALGTSSLNASGVATFSSDALTAGTHSITASYGGDGNYNTSTSSVTLIKAGFALSASALSPSSVAAGSSADSTISITPSNGFNPSNVGLACAVTPQVNPALTCSVAAISVSSDSGTAKLTVTAAGASAALAPAMINRGSGMWLAFGLLIPAMLLSTGIGAHKRAKILACALAFLVIGGCLLQTACGGGSASTPPPPTGNTGTPAGTYTVTVTGTANGVQNVASPLTLTVQ